MAKNKTEMIIELMEKKEQIRNIGIVAHIDHGKSTLSDNLVAGAGMISEDLAGKMLFTDFDPQEKERGITIYAANVSMVHDVGGKDYLINLIDTPGHVDFGGDVTRAMRAVDGAIIVNDAVEGIMPQTETVVRQALKERVKPVLFINKVDRLINELKFTPEQMQERFKKIITNINLLIQKYVEPAYKDKFVVSVNDGSVAFGSAKLNWAISIPTMQQKGITFKDVIEMTEQGRSKELAQKSPLHQVVLDMVVRHLPSPDVAQKYRVPRIWSGDMESPAGKAMMTCDPNGPLAAVVTKMYPTPHGFITTVRIFSGKIEKGKDVLLVGTQKTEKVQIVSVYQGPHRVPMDAVYAGNIVGIVGLKDTVSGETLADPENPIPGFEAITHIFEPVVTKAIEPKKPQDLAKLIEILKRISREDPTLRVKINEDTGEYLVSGLGELHLDAKVERKLKEEEIDVSVSPPIVIYRESVRSKSPTAVEGKSPNKHNRFFVISEKMEDAVYAAMVDGKIKDQEMKKKDQELLDTLAALGMERDEIRKIKSIYSRNMLLDTTKGVNAILEIMEMVKEAFNEAMNEGPLAREPVVGVKVKLDDAKLHEDAIHRGPAQVIPAMRRAIRSSMMSAGAFLLEPKQIIRIDVPNEHLSGALRETNNRRGQVLDMTEERGATAIQAKMPVAEMMGFNSALKSATGGHGFFSMIDIVYEPLPRDLEAKVVSQIKKRKGITEEKEEEEEE